MCHQHLEDFQDGSIWLSHSLDINPCDYCLWGLLKETVYYNKPCNLMELEVATATVFQCYEVCAAYASKALLKMDRSATCLFGIRNYGVDINGYVRHPEKGLCLWLQQRSATKQTWPGKWDNMVGGGLSVGYTIMETAIKEAAEEASIPLELMKNLRPAGSVSFFFESERGLFPNTEFVFDLELPLDFVPFNSDGEVQCFQLLPAMDVLEKVFSPDFKTTSCPVIVDFLIRHGLVSIENEPNLPQVVELLHVPLQTIYRSCQYQPPATNGQDISA
ncbi:uncharacterized protein LOC126178436 isoform X5 [Schistocerca cancellata]|uniref:uncharacterized protein LOC126178436 isoform X5 n=1 Tax=Schistocerca cancellata TaxID=274614 RepID=UPI00211798D4|nr:uncharacterized protein LOC126178436 isoform X5 [Schistocerca cancellata]